jgi:hypothetical protein
MLIYFKRLGAGRILLDLWHRKEALIWIVALVSLVALNPTDHHYTLCPFHNLGWEFCPGCGIGRSIAYFFHLDLKASFMTHPLGIPAVIIIIHRIILLLTRNQPKYSFPKTN